MQNVEHVLSFRVTWSLPNNTAMYELILEDRVLDVPVCIYKRTRGDYVIYEHQLNVNTDHPLAVPIKKRYESSGYGVISTNTADEIGYNDVIIFESRA